MKFAFKLILWIFVGCLCVWVLIAGFGTRFIVGLPWGGRIADNIERQQERMARNMAPDETVTAQSAVSQIYLDLNWANVDIYASDGASVQVAITDAQKGEFDVRESDGRLTVRQQSNSWRFWLFNFARNAARVTVYVPRSYAGDLWIDTASGSIVSYDELTLGRLTVDAASGRTELRAPVTAQHVEINTASGRVELDAIRGARDCRIDSASGSIRVGGLQAERFDISSASGSTTVEGIVGGGKVECLSGSLRLDFAEVTGDVTLNVVSGSVRVTMPQNADIRTDVSTVSGNVKDDFSRHNGSYRFDVEGVSGRVEIEAK